jgi:hypothetical protein
MTPGQTGRNRAQIGLMLGFKWSKTAAATIAGVELLRRGALVQRSGRVA